jgi:HlyD family secretion protein
MKNPKLWRRVGWFVALGLLVAGIALGLVFGTPPQEVEVAYVTRGSWERTLEEDGRARARERFVMSSPLAGVVQRQTLHVGDCVEKGDPVATIFPSPSALLDDRTRAELKARREAADAALAQAQAGVQKSEVAKAHADAELARVRELTRSGAGTKQDLEHAELEAAAAKSDRSAAGSARDVAQHQRDVVLALLEPKAEGAPQGTLTLRAPVKACVLRVPHEDEGAVAPGTSLIELADPAALEVVVDLLSTDAIHVREGAEATLKGFGSNEVVRGRVRRVEPTATVRLSALGVEEQRVDVVVDPLESTKDWARVGDGYRVDVHIAVGRLDDTLVVPTSALFRDGPDWAVLAVENGRVLRAKVAVAGYGPLRSALQDGMANGATVVLEPPRDLTEGTRVRVRSTAR